MTHTTYLDCADIKDNDNLEALSKIHGEKLTTENELECKVDYDYDAADPSVGINSDQYSVNFVTYNKTDVSRFFDFDTLQEEIAIESDCDDHDNC